MKTAIIQSNYLPWKGYFDIIRNVDIFVFGDNAQYTKGDWRNRNRIKTPDGIKWLTVPVRHGSIRKKIFEVEINNSVQWTKKQRGQIEISYSKTDYYECYKKDIVDIFTKGFGGLSELNIFTIKKISRLLGIATEFVNAQDITSQTKTEGIIDICANIGADNYISGPSAKNYIDESQLANHNITLHYHNYGGYPEYPQLWGSFEHHISILDVIFNCGEEAPYYIWGWRDGD